MKHICLAYSALLYDHSRLQVGCVQRRAAVSALLGLGNCDGKQLLRQLNMYGFCRADVAKALQAITGSLPAQRD